MKSTTKVRVLFFVLILGIVTAHRKFGEGSEERPRNWQGGRNHKRGSGPCPWKKKMMENNSSPSTQVASPDVFFPPKPIDTPPRPEMPPSHPPHELPPHSGPISGPRPDGRKHRECKDTEVKIFRSCISRAKWEFTLVCFSILAIAISICLLVFVVVVAIKIINKVILRRKFRRLYGNLPCQNQRAQVSSNPVSTVNINNQDPVNMDDFVNINNIESTSTQTDVLQSEVQYPKFEHLSTTGTAGDFYGRNRNAPSNSNRSNSPKSNYHLLK